MFRTRGEWDNSFCSGGGIEVKEKFLDEAHFESKCVTLQCYLVQPNPWLLKNVVNIDERSIVKSEFNFCWVQLRQ